jgi:hypothetical protein
MILLCPHNTPEETFRTACRRTACAAWSCPLTGWSGWSKTRGNISFAPGSLCHLKETAHRGRTRSALLLNSVHVRCATTASFGVQRHAHAFSVKIVG